MLNYQSADKIFEHCLTVCGLINEKSLRATLAELAKYNLVSALVIKALHDLQTGADATYSKGKPNENGVNLSAEEWERRWNAWVASRKVAFYSRAALFLLAETDYFDYFLEILRTSDNLVFLSAASDVLQHATGCYLDEREEDLTKSQLVQWWEKQRPLLKQIHS
ncbi:MAG: hypothetical protein WCS37_05545 [Chloroflexota bacterium]|nr:hypothetical protein [Chloroflexota bacterium]